MGWRGRKTIGGFSKGIGKAGSHGGGADSSAGAVFAGRAVRGRGRSGRQADEGDSPRTSAARRHGISDVACAGGGGTPVRPGCHYSPGQAGAEGYHGGTSEGIGDLGGRFRSSGWRRAAGREFGLAVNVEPDAGYRLGAMARGAELHPAVKPGRSHFLRRTAGLLVRWLRVSRGAGWDLSGESG